MKFSNFDFVYISVDYLRELHKADSEVFFSENSNYDKKPHLGVLVNNEDKKYVIPLTSAKQKHKKWDKTSLTYYLIYELVNIEKTKIGEEDVLTDVSNLKILTERGVSKNDYYKYKNRLLSVLEIKKMFPVAEGTYKYIDMNKQDGLSEKEFKQLALLKKEYLFCKKIEKDIEEKAKQIYNKQVKTNRVLKFHCDYKKLEEASKLYVESMENIRETRMKKHR